MASEYPRQHVWSGDPHSSLTWLVNVGPELGGSGSQYFLIKSPTPVAAIAVAVGEILPISDDWRDIVVVCRPLHEHEIGKVFLKDSEVLRLDDDSHAHLTAPPTGEDNDEDD